MNTPQSDATEGVETLGGVSVHEYAKTVVEAPTVAEEWVYSPPSTPIDDFRFVQEQTGATCERVMNADQNLRAFADAEWRMRAGKRRFKREFERWQSRVTPYETVPEFWQRKSRA